MAETLVSIRRLQKEAAFPIPVNPTAVRYIVVDIVAIQILVALFRPVMHPRGTSRQIWVRAHIEIHLLLTSHKDVMNDDIIINVKAVGVQGKIADIGIQQISTEMNGGLFLESFKAIPYSSPGSYFNKFFVCDRFCCRINYAKTVLCTVENHDMVNNFSRLVNAIVNGVRPMCEAGLEDGDNDNDRDKPSPRPDCRRNENKFICLFLNSFIEP